MRRQPRVENNHPSSRHPADAAGLAAHAPGRSLSPRLRTAGQRVAPRRPANNGATCRRPAGRANMMRDLPRS
jgi:hypothetical protein